MFLIYTPPFHAVFGGSHKLLPLYWLIPIAFGVLILAWSSLRVVLARRSIERTRVKDIQGLKMCKCPPGLCLSTSGNHADCFLKSLQCVPPVCVRGIERYEQRRILWIWNTRYKVIHELPLRRLLRQSK